MSDLVCMEFAGAKRGMLPSEWISTLNHPNQDHDDGHDQQNVDEAAHRVRRGQT